MSIALDDVRKVIKEILDDLQEDLDFELGDLNADAKLTDMGMESISLVYLVSELQQHYQLGDSVFRNLRAEGRLLTEMTVEDIVQSVATAPA